jgi:hypothetical protein
MLLRNVGKIIPDYTVSYAEDSRPSMRISTLLAAESHTPMHGTLNIEFLVAPNIKNFLSSSSPLNIVSANKPGEI